nr:hypothetical protein [Tanacetum cinerariifolium]
KRAQIFVADLWAAFDGESYGEFNDIDKVTMFADYRVPQMLHSLGMMWFCPSLEAKIRRLEIIESGHTWEMQIRGKSKKERRKVSKQYLTIEHGVYGIEEKTLTVVRSTNLTDASERSGRWTRIADVSQLSLLQHQKGLLTIFEWYTGLSDYVRHTSLPELRLSQDASHLKLMQMM